ncbi:MAG: hypothetical protein ABI639_08885 [Thermoanaerobaculia bacterium]
MSGQVRTKALHAISTPTPVDGFRSSHPIGAFEQLPKWLNLVPMVAQWLWLGLRHRSLTLPSTVNPGITSGGLVGEGKQEYFAAMGPLARAATAPHLLVRVGAEDPARILERMLEAGLAFPLVAKPDLGWCGYGVRLLADAVDLQRYLRSYPAREDLILQRYLAAPGEAGLFYMRHPDAPRGELIGVLLRHFPRVVGDGRQTIAELVGSDGRLARTTRGAQHECRYEALSIPARGEVVRLSLIGSTRVGGLYEDGSDLINPALTERVEAIARDMGPFHVGRFDVRYTDRDSLSRGDFTIMEVNGAGSEAVHAWDPKYSISDVYRIVFAKQRRLFAIGAAMRRSGHRPIGVAQLARLHLRQQRLMRSYPPSN